VADQVAQRAAQAGEVGRLGEDPGRGGRRRVGLEGGAAASSVAISGVVMYPFALELLCCDP